MGKHALSTRLILAPTLAMVLGLGFGLTSSIITNNQIRESHISKTMALAAHNASHDFHDSLIRVKTAVEEAQLIAQDQFPIKDSIIDDESFNTGLDKMSKFYGLVAKNTEYVCAYWCVVDPSIRGARPENEPGDGFLYHRDKGSTTYSNEGATNLSKYLADPDKYKDGISWWLAVRDGRNALWMNPYYNANVDQNIITYSMPFRAQDGTFLGAVGLDLEFDEIAASIDTPLEEFPGNTAKPFLAEKNGHLLWHPNYASDYYDENGHYKSGWRHWTDIDPDFRGELKDNLQLTYRFEGVKRHADVRELSNDTFYVLAVDDSVLIQPFVWSLWTPVLCYLIAAVLIAVAIALIVRRSLKPLHKLNEAVRKVEEGDLSVQIQRVTDDEVGELSESMGKMVASLRAERAALNALAFSDGLTGVKNQGAFREKVEQLDASIRSGMARFAVIMCDVDGLKVINDTQGHINGDKAIRSACLALCRAFKQSPVYRVGGDEFVAIVEGNDYEKKETLTESVRATSGTEATNYFSFSVGLATFQPGIDESFDAVFRRADGIMYQEKRRKKPQ